MDTDDERRELPQEMANASGKAVHICKVQGCTRDLRLDKPYYKRCGVCPAHLRSLELLVDGQMQRFCQQETQQRQLDDFGLQPSQVPFPQRQSQLPPVHTPPLGHEGLSAMFQVPSAGSEHAVSLPGAPMHTPKPLTEDPASAYHSGRLLQRLSLKLYGCSPGDLMAGTRAKLQTWLASMNLQLLQMTVRHGCVHLIVDVLTTLDRAGTGGSGGEHKAAVDCGAGASPLSLQEACGDCASMLTRLLGPVAVSSSGSASSASSMTAGICTPPRRSTDEQSAPKLSSRESTESRIFSSTPSSVLLPRMFDSPDVDFISKDNLFIGDRGSVGLSKGGSRQQLYGSSGRSEGYEHAGCFVGDSLHHLLQDVLGSLFGQQAPGKGEAAGHRVLVQLDEQVMQWRAQLEVSEESSGNEHSKPLDTWMSLPPDVPVLRDFWPPAVVAGQASSVQVTLRLPPAAHGRILSDGSDGEGDAIPPEPTLLHLRYGDSFSGKENAHDWDILLPSTAELSCLATSRGLLFGAGDTEGIPASVTLQVRLPALPAAGLAFLESSCGDLLGPWQTLLVVPSEGVATELGALLEKHGRPPFESFFCDVGRLLTLAGLAACLDEDGFTDDWDAYEAYCEFRETIPDAVEVAARVLHCCSQWKLPECTGLAISLLLELWQEPI